MINTQNRGNDKSFSHWQIHFQTGVGRAILVPSNGEDANRQILNGPRLVWRREIPI